MEHRPSEITLGGASGERDSGVPHVRGVSGTRHPTDARFFGWVHFAFGILGLLLSVAVLAGIARPVDSEWSARILFGTIQAHSGFWIGLNGIIWGGATILGGYGVARGETYGWWLLLLFHIQNLPTMLVNFTDAPGAASIWVAVSVVVLAWLLWRIRLFHPFGRKPVGSKLPVADSVGQDAPPMPSAREDKME